MNIIIASVILGAVALIALYWPRPKHTKAEIIVRLYHNGRLVMTGDAKCEVLYFGGKMVVTEAKLSDLPKDITADRVTLAIPGFDQLEAECGIEGPFEAYKHSDLTFVTSPGEIGILVVQ